MPLTPKQTGIRNGLFAAAVATLPLVALSSLWNPFHFAADLDLAARFAVVAKSALLPCLMLAFSIGRLARQHFATPEDIDATAETSTPRARMLQAEIQSTLEQTVVATLAYAAWAAVMPANWLSAVPSTAIAFALGRAAFFWGYERGAPARAFGFGLSFFPSLFMLALLALRIGEGLVGPAPQ